MSIKSINNTSSVVDLLISMQADKTKKSVLDVKTVQSELKVNLLKEFTPLTAGNYAQMLPPRIENSTFKAIV